MTATDLSPATWLALLVLFGIVSACLAVEQWHNLRGERHDDAD